MLGMEDLSVLLPSNLSYAFHKEFDVVKWETNCTEIPNRIWLANLWCYFEEQFVEYRSQYITEQMEIFNRDAKDDDKGDTTKPLYVVCREKEGQLAKEAKENFIRDLLRLFGNWNLFPALEYGDTEHDAQKAKLYRLDIAHKFIMDLKGINDDILRKAFESLRIPTPDQLSIDKIHVTYPRPRYSPYKTLASELVARISSPLAILKCLYSNREHFLAQSRSPEECSAILTFLNNSLERMRKCDDEDVTAMIRSLPFFTTISGITISIDNDSCTYIVHPMGVPEKGIQTWGSKKGITILVNNDNLNKLYQCVGCIVETPFQFYIGRVLKNFDFVPDSAILDHIQHIRDVLLPCSKQQEQSIIQRSLNVLRFILVKNSRHCAGTFYNGSIALFNAMCYDEEKMPKCFCTPEWHNFMIFAGMKSEVTEDIFSKLAKRLEK